MRKDLLLQDIQNAAELSQLFGAGYPPQKIGAPSIETQDSLLIKLWLSKLHILTFNHIILTKLSSPFLTLAFKNHIQLHEEQLKRIKLSLTEAQYHYSFIKTNRLNSLLGEELNYVNFSKQCGSDSRIIEIAIKWVNYEITAFTSLCSLSYKLHSNAVFKQTKFSLLELKGLQAWLYQTKEYFH